MAALPALQLPNTRLPGPLRPAKSFTVLSTTQEEPSWAPPLLPPHEDDSCRAQGREPHAFSKQVANESHGVGLVSAARCSSTKGGVAPSQNLNPSDSESGANLKAVCGRCQ